MYTIVPVLAAAIGQVQRDPHAMTLLTCTLIGGAVYLLLDLSVVAWLARMWAHHVRASRGR